MLGVNVMGARARELGRARARGGGAESQNPVYVRMVP